MLIKKSDDQREELENLERLAKTGRGDAAKHAARDLAIRTAGIKGEQESAYLIDFHFGDSVNWAVIHDLRIEYNGRVAQIDHLLINRWMECYVLETKHFRDGVKITEHGEFMRWNSFKRSFEGMPSPLEQNDRHIAVLRDAMKTIDLPTRLGVRIQLAFLSLVLVSPSARIDRPRKFDSEKVSGTISSSLDGIHQGDGLNKLSLTPFSGCTPHSRAAQSSSLSSGTIIALAPMIGFSHAHTIKEGSHVQGDRTAMVDQRSWRRGVEQGSQHHAVQGW